MGVYICKHFTVRFLSSHDLNMGSMQSYFVKGIATSIVKCWCVHKWPHLAKANNSSVNEEKAILYWKELAFKAALLKQSHRTMEIMRSSSQLLILSHPLSLTAFSAFSILPGKLCLENNFPLPPSWFLVCLLEYFLSVFLLTIRDPLGQVTEIKDFLQIRFT